MKRTNDDGVTALAYDARGFLTSLETPSATLVFERDDLGRIVAEEQDAVRLERELDEMGRLLGHTTPFGLKSAFSWSPGGACTTIRYGETEVAFDRDALGRETRRRLGSAGAFEQAYDPVGRLVSQAFYSDASRGGSQDASAEPSLTRQFGFDARGFLSSIEDSLRGHTRLLHNDRGDLTGVVRERGLSDFYTYDPCQNRVYHAATEHGAALAAAMDRATRDRDTYGDIPVDVLAARFPHCSHSELCAPGNRPVTVASTDGSRIDLMYDANGQVITKTVARGGERHTWNFGWNARGELTSVTTPNGKTWTYRYDGAGRRIEKRSPTGDTWRYVWLGHELVQSLKNGELVETYVHMPAGTCPILRDDGELHFILPDQNDSPSEEVSATGKLEWSSHKGTWGEQAGLRGPCHEIHIDSLRLLEQQLTGPALASTHLDPLLVQRAGNRTKLRGDESTSTTARPTHERSRLSVQSPRRGRRIHDHIRRGAFRRTLADHPKLLGRDGGTINPMQLLGRT